MIWAKPFGFSAAFLHEDGLLQNATVTRQTSAENGEICTLANEQIWSRQTQNRVRKKTKKKSLKEAEIRNKQTASPKRLDVKSVNIFHIEIS